MTEKELFENFQQCFGRMMTPFETEDIRNWIRKVGIPVEVVNEALREAVLNNAINLKYINKILTRCQQENIDSAEVFRQRVEEFEKQKRSIGVKQSTQQTNVPDWAKEEHQSKPKELTSEQKAEMRKVFAELEALEKG